VEPDHRRSLWSYYERRAPNYEGGIRGAQRYFSGLAVDAKPEHIRAELHEVTHQLARLSPVVFLDVGVGPGVFKSLLPGRGFALDQSESALRRLRIEDDGVPVIRGDATILPIADNAVVRVFAGHLYGHLEERERLAFLAEARRVGDELVILDSGRPPGAEAEEWQVREMADGTSYTVYKRHFAIDGLVAEIGGERLFGGQYYVLARSLTARYSANE
jgi:hypothetical protein